MTPGSQIAAHDLAAPRWHRAVGDASVSITQDLYVHELPDQEADAAQRIGGALYRAEGQR